VSIPGVDFRAEAPDADDAVVEGDEGMILLQAESFEDEDISLRSDVGEISDEYRRVFRNDDCPFPELLA
jgi:hypothetical protein